MWAEQTWPERYKSHRKHIPLYGVGIALGRLLESVERQRLDRAHDPETEQKKIQNEVGHIVVNLIDFCSRHGWSFQEVVRDAWNDTKGEDFDPYPDVGRPRLE